MNKESIKMRYRVDRVRSSTLGEPDLIDSAIEYLTNLKDFNGDIDSIKLTVYGSPYPSGKAATNIPAKVINRSAYHNLLKRINIVKNFRGITPATMMGHVNTLLEYIYAAYGKVAVYTYFGRESHEEISSRTIDIDMFNGLMRNLEIPYVIIVDDMDVDNRKYIMTDT